MSRIKLFFIMPIVLVIGFFMTLCFGLARLFENIIDILMNKIKLEE